jgi:predicted DNA-binding transcriptional regulator AlpA
MIVDRRVRVSQLAGVDELAAELGVSRDAIHKWRKRHSDFPEPVATLSMGMLWSRPDVIAWAKKTGRLAKPDPD